jgi:Uma2 family endonuclease
MNAPLKHIADGLPRRRFSVADFVRMGEVGLIAEDERVELLDGEIVPLPSKGIRHEVIKVDLAMFWGRRCPREFIVAQETGLYLSDSTYLEPDFIVFERAIGLANVRGPDVLLAVEVADSSLGYDLGRKPVVYALHGVRELWVIDAVRRVVHLHRGLEGEGYREVVERGSGERLVPAFAPPDFAFSLDGIAEG